MHINYVEVFSGVFGLILAIGFSANASALALAIKYSSFKKNQLDVLLLNMVVADLLTLVPMPFVLGSVFYYTWLWGDAFCKIFQFCSAFSLAASIYSLCAISFARARIILRPYRTPKIATMAFLLISVLVIASDYVRLALFLPRSPMMSVVSSKNTRRASVMIFTATATFLACWLPVYILELCIYLRIYHHSYSWDTFDFVCNILQYLHPCVNPVLYVLLSKRYRNQKTMLCCQKSRVHPQSHSITGFKK